MHKNRIYKKMNEKDNKAVLYALNEIMGIIIAGGDFVNLEKVFYTDKYKVSINIEQNFEYYKK